MQKTSALCCNKKEKEIKCAFNSADLFALTENHYVRKWENKNQTPALYQTKLIYSNLSLLSSTSRSSSEKIRFRQIAKSKEVEYTRIIKGFRIELYQTPLSGNLVSLLLFIGHNHLRSFERIKTIV